MDHAEIEALVVRLMKPRRLWARLWEDRDRQLAAEALTGLMSKFDRVEGQLTVKEGLVADLNEKLKAIKSSTRS